MLNKTRSKIKLGVKLACGGRPPPGGGGGGGGPLESVGPRQHCGTFYPRQHVAFEVVSRSNASQFGENPSRIVMLTSTSATSVSRKRVQSEGAAGEVDEGRPSPPLAHAAVCAVSQPYLRMHRNVDSIRDAWQAEGCVCVWQA